MIKIQQIQAEDTWPIRHEVMWPDQAIEYVILPGDRQALHFGLFKEKKLVSIISLFKKEEKAQFRKFATLREEQGKGYGTQLLNFLFDFVKKDASISIFWCNARVEKAGYYEGFGLKTTEQTFEKGGLQYVVMETRI